MVAYGLAVGLIAVVGINAVTTIGVNIDDMFGTVSTELDGAINPAAPTAPEGATTLSANPATIGDADVSGPGSPAFGNGITTTITNAGSLSTGTLTTSSTGVNFQFSPDSCNGSALAPGQSCSITVTAFAAVNGAYTGSLSVGDGSNSVTIPLQGNAGSFAPASCAEILAAVPGSPDGVYEITPDTGGRGSSENLNCDMTTDGGGWTQMMVWPNSSNVRTDNRWTNSSNTGQLTGTSQHAWYGLNIFSSNSTGDDLEIMWEVNNVKRRIYRNLPLSGIFSGNGGTAIAITSAQTKVPGGSYINLVDSTVGKGGWFYGFYDNSTVAGTDLGYERCGWLLGNGGLYGLSTDPDCDASGFSNLQSALIELWVR
ncbi:MAG: hypothetical protein Alpg2KO_09100 [Alphaproteobacteria bacterium]